MAHAGVLALLETLAIASCCYGLYELGAGISVFGNVGFAYGSCWFAIGASSNLCGLFALYLMYFGPEDEISRGSQFWVQYHYLLAWLTIVLGYPTYLTLIWMVHYPSPYIHLHLILAIAPLIAWMNRRTRAIVFTTQLVSVFGIISHIWISILTKNRWGLGGAGLMIMNVAALSIPTKYNIWGFSSRELYVIGLAGTSFIFSQQVAQTIVTPAKVGNIFAFDFQGF